MSLVLFTKIANPGACKTRLQDFLSEAQCADVALALQKHMLHAARATNIPLELALSGVPSELHEENPAEKLFVGYSWYPQEGAGLGERMYNALAGALTRADRAVLFGSDLANLTSHTIQAAHQALDTYDVVITPTADGGYGLIGMTHAYPELFALEQYSTPQVFEQTLAQAKKLGLRVKVFDQIWDVDTKEDLVRAHVGADHVEVLGFGEYNLNFLCTTYAQEADGPQADSMQEVVRVALGSQMNLGAKQIPYEYHALKLLEPSGVTPRAYRLIEPSVYVPYPALSMEYVEGRPLDYAQDLPLAAKLLSRIHGLAVSDKDAAQLIMAKRPFLELYQECERMFSVYQNWEHKDAWVEKQLLEFFACERELGLEDAATEKCIINTELNNTNFVVGTGGARSVVIDWEKPLFGEKEQDLGHFLAPTTTNFRSDYVLSDQEVDAFLSAYEEPFDMQKLHKYVVFTCLRGLTWCAMAQVEYAGDRALKHEGTQKKIEEYLSKEFLQMIAKRYEEALA